MRIGLAAVTMFLAATVATAEEQPLNGAAITAVLADTTLIADGDVQQVFQKGGLTLYTQGVNTSQGFWKVEGDAYCSQWPPNETWSCYEVTQGGDEITFIGKTGKRYPMRRSD
jgi:hypothetical protein